MDMQKVLDSTTDAMLVAQMEANPKLRPVASTLRDSLAKYMSWESLEEDYIKIYVDAFTQRETEDIAAFYKTPAGMRSLEMMPELMQKGAMMGQRRVQEHMGELRSALQARLEQLEFDKPRPAKQ